jgi:hypothetical protein
MMSHALQMPPRPLGYWSISRPAEALEHRRPPSFHAEIAGITRPIRDPRPECPGHQLAPTRIDFTETACIRFDQQLVATLATTYGIRLETSHGPLATSWGSVENMNVSLRHDWAPYSRHAAAAMVESLIPRCRRSGRLDQCVTPYFTGGGASIDTTSARSIIRGRPERGSASNPASPSAADLFRQSITVGRDPPPREPAPTRHDPDLSTPTPPPDDLS